jgi:predicted peroxiredoxin
LTAIDGGRTVEDNGYNQEGAMSVILFSSTFGSDDPTRATIPFVAALGAIEAGHEAQLGLLGEATYIIKDEIAAHIHGMGFSPLSEMWPQVVKHKVPVYV